MKPLIPFLFLFLMLIGCSNPGQFYEYTGEPFNYEIYFGEKLQGSQSIMVNEDGTLTNTFEFNDRGRGPKYLEHIKLDGEGRMISMEITGNNYLKDTVNEVFNVNNGNATWQSTSEKGDKSWEGEHYANIDGSFAASEILINRLLKNKNKSLQLLPGGETKIVTNQSFTFQDSITLDLIGVTGLGFVPSYVWMDKDKRFFASISDWFSCIRTGYDALRGEMWDIQKTIEDQYYAKVTEQLTTKPEKGILLKNVQLLDVESGTIKNDQSIIIEGNKIKEIGSNNEINTTEALDVIDGQGKFCMPGLFDMHVHYNKSDGMLHLACGVTSVRDLANSLSLLEVRDSLKAEALIGPRIVVLAGFVDGAGPYAGPTGAIINNVEEGYQGIKEYAEKGYKHIKLYSSIKPEWVKPLVDYAHGLGMRVSGHIPAFMTAEQAINQGYDEIQHINMIMLNFMSDTLDTRTPVRFTAVAENARSIELDGSDFRSFVNLLLREEIVVDPTVSIFEGMFKGKVGEPDPSYIDVIERLPIQAQRGFKQGGLPGVKEQPQIYAESYDKMLATIRKLFDAGVTIVPGTDALVGFTLHRELELYASTGIPNIEVLKMATITSAKVAGRESDLGTIETGKLADIILIDGNPLENISDIRNVALTIKNGNIYEPNKLFQSVGVKPK